MKTIIILSFIYLMSMTVLNFLKEVDCLDRWHSWRIYDKDIIFDDYKCYEKPTKKAI